VTVPAPDWPVMAITKCRIWASPVNRFTVASRALSQCARTPAMTLARMEKTMSKNTAVNTADRELTTAELELVAGGVDTGTLNAVEAGIFTGFGFLVGMACYETGHVGWLKAGLHR
jgi:hypothetical protein